MVENAISDEMLVDMLIVVNLKLPHLLLFRLHAQFIFYFYYD